MVRHMMVLGYGLECTDFGIGVRHSLMARCRMVLGYALRCTDFWDRSEVVLDGKAHYGAGLCPKGH